MRLHINTIYKLYLITIILTIISLLCSFYILSLLDEKVVQLNCSRDVPKVSQNIMLFNKNDKNRCLCSAKYIFVYICFITLNQKKSSLFLISLIFIIIFSIYVFVYSKYTLRYIGYLINCAEKEMVTF